MKIGIDARCLEWSRGGVSRYLVNMLKLWPKLTSRHRFVLYFQNYIPDDEFLRNPVFELRLLRGPSFLRSHKIVAEQVLMPRQLSKDNLDLFFATCYSAPLLYRSGKTVVAAWDISYTTHPEHYSLPHRLSLGYFSRRSCKRASGVVTCSLFDAKQIEKHYDVPSKNIQTIFLAADSRFVSELDPIKICEFRKKYNLPSKFILSMGVVHNRRNVDVVIRAFNLIKENFPDFSLVVIGRNETRPFVNIEALMRPLAKEGRAIYMRWFEDEALPLLYQAAHSYICTSTVDGETIMLKEAMQSGTIVITSPLLRDTIGGNGLIINDPNSVKETAEVLSTAMKPDFDRAHLIDRGIAWTKAISWSRAAEDSLKFFESR